jgi:hypothetical protein
MLQMVDIADFALEVGYRTSFHSRQGVWGLSDIFPLEDDRGRLTGDQHGAWGRGVHRDYYRNTLCQTDHV